MSDQNKLTPEMFSKNNGIYFSPGDIVEGGFYGISHSDFMEYVDQFSQQAAAKDERIQRLEGFLRTRTAERDGVIELRDKLKSDNKAKNERIKELEAEAEAWGKDEELALLNNSIDQKVARIAELEKVLQNKLVGEAEGNIIHASDAYHEIADILSVKDEGSVIASVQQLLEKVEQLEKELKDKRERNSELHRELTGIRSSVRVVGRLREDIKVLNDEANIKNQQLRADLDQAFDLLERVYNIEMVHPGKEDIPLLEMISTLLSSRENKKP